MTCRERLMFYIYNYVFVILIYNCLPCCLLLSTTLLLSAILHYQVLPGLGQAHFKSHQNPSNDWIDWWYLFSLFRRYNDGYRLVYLPTSQHSLEIISYVFVKAGQAGQIMERKHLHHELQPTINKCCRLTSCSTTQHTFYRY